MKSNIFRTSLIIIIFIVSNVSAWESDSEYTWESTKVAKNIKKQYGSVKMIENGLKITTGRAYNGFVLHIETELDLVSIEIYEDSSPFSPIATYKVPKDSIIEYKITINTEAYGYVTVIGKEKNGTLHIAKERYMRCLGDCEGHGG